LIRSPSKLVQRRSSRQVRFKVLRVMVKKNSIFWDITPCSPLTTNRFFGRICRLHPQGRRINQARNQHEACSKQRWRRHVPPKRRLTFNGLHRVTSQNTEIF
jgi:hypothetical protein